jgi:hypothetical protein
MPPMPYAIPRPKSLLKRGQFWIIIAITTGLLYLCAWAISESEKDWARYAAENHCRVVSRLEAEVILNTGKVGNFVIPSRTTYTCDGGVTVTR